MIQHHKEKIRVGDVFSLFNPTGFPENNGLNEFYLLKQTDGCS
jgi:hypothetical protein